MKNRSAWILALCAMLLLVGCAGTSQPESTQPAAQAAQQTVEAGTNELGIATLGDVLAIDPDARYTSSSYYFIYVLQKDGTYYRAVAELTDEVSEAIDALDFFADDYFEQVEAIIAPLPVIEVRNLSAYIPADMDQWVGKSGAEMMQDGYEVTGYSFYEEFNNFYVTKGLCEWEVAVNEPQPQDDDNYDADAGFAATTIRSVTFSDFTYLATEYPGDF